MDFKILTEEDYAQLMQKLAEIESAVKEKMNPQKKIYANEDLCKLLDVSKRTCQTWRDNGLIEFSQIGGKIYYTWQQIQTFLEKHKVDAHT